MKISGLVGEGETKRREHAAMAVHVDGVYTELARDCACVLRPRAAEGRKYVLREFEASHLR